MGDNPHRPRPPRNSAETFLLTDNIHRIKRQFAYMIYSMKISPFYNNVLVKANDDLKNLVYDKPSVERKDFLDCQAGMDC